jgi:hypothetical protein
MSECLSPDQLRALLDGAAADGAAEHVEGCPACQLALEQLTRGTLAPPPGCGPAAEEPGQEFLHRLEQACLDTSAESAAPAADAPPANVVGYRVVRLIGRGG